MSNSSERFLHAYEQNGTVLPPLPDGSLLEEILEKMETVARRLPEWNEKINLTAITDPDGILYKHFIDSLTVCAEIPQKATVIDVGCGAGFPSLPLAIFRPDLRITAMDSTAKKLTFIDAIIRECSLTNLQTLAGRAEDLSKKPEYRERFDVCVSRAVAGLPVLSELCLPFVRPNGRWISLKGPTCAEEYEKAEKGIRTLGGGLASAQWKEFSLIHPGGEDSRTNLLIYKECRTPEKYPRVYGQIKSKPL